MKHVEVVVIGGGQAGLAMSHCLLERGIEHVVLERGRVGERWRSERWDSLRLFTPRWQSRLPGWSYRGPDPHGYMSSPEVVAYLDGYAASFPVPLETGVTVTAVERHPRGYRVSTDGAAWTADNVVVATGECDTPLVPSLAADLSGDVHQVVPTRYRNPDDLPAGGVLVVGASATGIQLAEEIHASGRPVTIAVGRHTRLPRTYRGRDILWWFDRMGIFDETTSEVGNVEASRNQPSLQLVGTPEARALDLGVLHRGGVEVVGRARSARGSRVFLEDDLVETTVAADAKLSLLLHRIDEYVAEAGLEAEMEAPDEIRPVELPEAPRSIDLRARGIGSVLWATGFRRSYPWLRVPVLDRRGEILHDGGITPEPGLYVIGLRFLRRRRSSFLDGVARDAHDLADHIDGRRRDGRRVVA